MNTRKKILWITRTAVLTALLVTLQFATAALGNQFVTGSIVNLMLIVSLLTCGPASGLTVAVISPLCASLVGVGPAFPPLIPFIILGNVSFVAAWILAGSLNKTDENSVRYKIIGVVSAIVSAAVKSLVLYAGIVQFAVPILLDLNEKQSAMITLSFSYPQLITATIGGVIALAVVPPVRKAIRLRHTPA